MSGTPNNAATTTRVEPPHAQINVTEPTLKLPKPTNTLPPPSVRLAGHRAVLIEESVFAKLQELQKNPMYYTANGLQHEFGASLDLRLIATALMRLALEQPALCDAAVAEALATLRQQLTQLSSSPTTTIGSNKND